MNGNSTDLMKMHNPLTNKYSDAPIPSWLETSPISQVKPPVETRVQELPFGELWWEDFERLCLRLARLEANVEHCQIYGVPGQNQEGIDIYARQKFSEKFRVYQCKRVNNFGPSKIKEAIRKFIEGEWVSKTDSFVLCTKEGLNSKDRSDEIETQSSLLREKGVTLLVWDSNQLSMKLKDLPKLVDDFFGRAWVDAFCGKEEAKRLGKRLDASKVYEFRKKLAAFYKHVFNTHDPGLPIITLGKAESLPLENRYVLPDVYDRGTITIPHSNGVNEPKVSEDELLRNRPFSDATLERGQGMVKTQRSSVAYQQRHAIEKWLAAASRSIILGGPGSGKSTLLRFIVLDLLQESPRLTFLSQKWGQFLPVWVPFALWTKMITDQPVAACSLSDLLHGWLKSWDEERLWLLVEQALEDERLFLLVDGLDEWTNESAARIALDRLKVFIEQRNIPAIITSRPHGFERLGMQETGWQLGELSDFSTTQQRQLSRIWFTYWIQSQYQDSNYKENEIERKINSETEGFLTELQRSADIQELAKVPLLLCMLIYHRFHNVGLPQNRFKAYDLLIEHLIFAHPQKRRKAASITGMSPELSDDDLKRIFARLAYQIQECFGEGLIDYNEAITIVEDYLKDFDCGFGFERSEARRYSREVLEVGENTIGLLVKRSPKEIGFFHRVFQEYLAACHLSCMPLVEQLTIVDTGCADPQWHEVILGLFHITSRPDDIQQFVNRIKTKFKEVNTVEPYAIDLLLCKIAFGDFNCSVSLTRELAQKSFRQVELESWMPHRERLLQHILDGLRSTKIKDLVKSKLMSWFPCRVRWRENILTAMASWPRVSEVIECLWRGIHNEETNNQRAAARALADLAEGDLEIGNRIASLALSAVDPNIRAAAIKALLHGWPDHEGIEHILKAARNSMSPELRLVAILGRIQQHAQNEEDRQELIRLGSLESGMDYYWRSEVPSALMSGWPNSPETKKACFEALRKGEVNWKQLDRELAVRILLESYPQDNDVEQFCVHEIKYEKYPFNFYLHFDAWRLLNQNFKNHPQIVEAIDEWIPKQEFSGPEVSIAALVGRTPKAKEKILSLLSSHSFPHWPAFALIEGWGMKDTEVAERLRQIAFGSVAEASRIGYLLPQIIEDKAKCRSRLLELLRNPECARSDFAMDGLKALGNTQGDTEVVDIVLNLVLNRLDRKSLDYQSVIGLLIMGYSLDERVKELAKQELSERDGNYLAIAKAYGDDEQIRKRIIEIASPLPTRLRGVIATRLGEGGGDEAFAMSLLKLYDFEQDEGVKTQASISYHTQLKALGQDISPVLETLSQGIVCYGFDHEERRQAAFCGLVILARLDIMVNAKETIGSDSPCAISITKRISSNIPLLRLILQNWDYIKAALGDEFWQRLSNIKDPNLLDLWDVFCMFVEEYHSPCDEALSFLENNMQRKATRNILRFLGRLRPKSPLLLEYCLKAINIGVSRDYHSIEEAVIAAELLGKHFWGDNDVLSRIISGYDEKNVHEGVILALCEGWPESEDLERRFESVHKQRKPLSYATFFQLNCRKDSSKNLFDDLMKVLLDSQHSYYLRNNLSTQMLHRPLIRRLKKDNDLFSMLTERLNKNATPSEKATIPRLIGAARGVSSELRTWCIDEANRQTKGTGSTEVGFDLIICELRPVVHSLLDVLSQPSYIE